MCELHDTLESQGFVGTDLERLLVRLLFCLFADDTGVFEPSTFETFVRNQTREDGSDVGARLNELFDVLDKPENDWPESIRETFAGFRYVNGDLFKHALKFPPFTRRTRDSLLAACEFQWARDRQPSSEAYFKASWTTRSAASRVLTTLPNVTS